MPEGSPVITRSPNPAPAHAKLRPPALGNDAGSSAPHEGVPPAHHACATCAPASPVGRMSIVTEL